MNCERCGAEPEGYDLFDYCAVCSKNLCSRCAKNGCCRHRPMKSGMEADYPEENTEDADG